MKTEVTAFFIDAVNKEIKEIEIPLNDRSSLDFLSKVAAPFSGIICAGKTITKDQLDNTLYCDDEGLLHPANINPGFSFKGEDSMIIGNAVIEGTDEYGYGCDSNLTLEEVHNLIEFRDFSKEELEKRLDEGFKFIPIN